MRLSRKHELSMTLSRKPELKHQVAAKDYRGVNNVAFGSEKEVIRPKGPAKKNNLAPILSENYFSVWTKSPCPPPP